MKKYDYVARGKILSRKKTSDGLVRKSGPCASLFLTYCCSTTGSENILNIV